MKHAALCLLVVAAGPTSLLADCGSIPYRPVARIFEPNQRALISWSGTEEILVLSTDLRASVPTKVLEVIPLPGRPTVHKGDMAVFTKAVKLINDQQRRLEGDIEGGLGTFGGGGGGAHRPPPAKVTFHKKIGATDVSVVRVLRARGFLTWVEKYLKAQSVDQPKIPAPLQAVVTEYLQDGFTWFVFNVVSLGPDTKTKQALEYRFPSGSLYYPLRITRTETGRTKVRLLILTQELLPKEQFKGVARERITMPHKPVPLDEDQLRDLHLSSYILLGRPRKAKLRIWEMEGELRGFRKDILVGGWPVFFLRHERTKRVVGPIAFRSDSPCRIGKREFTVKTGGSATHFQLRHEETTRRYGPFPLKDNQRIEILGETFVLLLDKPEPPDEKEERPDK